ncbi:MAG: NYN domain-containing protein [Candidatus Paceibacterota bacterium]
MIEYKDQRIGIFIDVQNLYHSAKNIYDSRVNYKELIGEIAKDKKLVRAFAYVVQSEKVLPGTEKGLETVTGKTEASFFDALEKTGLTLRIKDIQVFQGGVKKADWDVGMAIDAVRMSQDLDIIVLMTGDGDFLPLLDYLQLGKGKEVWVAAFSKSSNNQLKEVADRFIAIEEIPQALTKIRRKRGAKKPKSAHKPKKESSEK